MIPYQYTVKCPVCGADIPLSKVIDQTSFYMKAKTTRCRDCGKLLGWSETGLRRVTASLVVLVICLASYLLAIAIWPALDERYLAFPALASLLCALLCIHFAKLEALPE